MAEITAKLVNELRAKTGQGMMECKKALTEVGGELEKAIEYFRKKGIKTSLTERAATEGTVSGVRADDGKSAALAEINCNTDFTAKSTPIQVLATTAARLLLANPDADVAQAAQVSSEITQVAQTTGENVRVGRTAYLSNPNGKVGLYMYATAGKGKIGVLLSVNGNPTDELLNDLGMHIAAARPLAHQREHLPADIVEREKSLAIEQATASGKPQNIAEKIAEGKMRTFYEERVLADQQFINADKFKGSITQMLDAGKTKLEKYIRLEVGQA